MHARKANTKATDYFAGQKNHPPFSLHQESDIGQINLNQVGHVGLQFRRSSNMV